MNRIGARERGGEQLPLDQPAERRSPATAWVATPPEAVSDIVPRSSVPSSSMVRVSPGLFSSSVIATAPPASLPVTIVRRSVPPNR